MTGPGLDLIAAGTAFATEDIVFWADPAGRGLDAAITEAELLVSCPAATAALPAELEPWLVAGVTRAHQHAVADVPGRDVGRRWAEIDPTVLYVENPQSRFATSLLRDPTDADDAAALADVLAEVARRGSDVYESTRDLLIRRLLTEHPASPARPTTALTLITALDPDRRLPDVLTLANHGDPAGNPLSGERLPTMQPERARMLADSLRTGFRVSSHDAVALNLDDTTPDEAIATARRFGRDPQRPIDAVRATLRREYVLGGGDATDPDQVDLIAKRLRRSWAHYRAMVG